MHIREAILKAAAHIEQHPDQYAFMSNLKPDCGTPGCMLGWIGVFADAKAGDSWMRSTARLLGLNSMNDFLDRKAAIQREMVRQTKDWPDHHDPRAAAEILRRYADKYHPDPKAERNFARELMANLPAERIPDEVAS